MARGNPTCSIEGCDKPHFGRSWCLKHYTRWYRNGDPVKALPRSNGQSAIERICKRDRRENRGYLTPCRVWTMRLPIDGRARISIGSKSNGTRRSRLVYDVVYEHVYGTVTNEIHHRCGQKDCHEPLHLADLTRAAHAAEHRAMRSAATSASSPD